MRHKTAEESRDKSGNRGTGAPFGRSFQRRCGTDLASYGANGTTVVRPYFELRRTFERNGSLPRINSIRI